MILQTWPHIIANRLSILDARDPQPGFVVAKADETGDRAGEFFEAEVGEGAEEEVDFVVEFAERDGVGEVVEGHGCAGLVGYFVVCLRFAKVESRSLSVV